MKTLISRIETRVRFSEVDSMKIVWHGNYVKYLEDGREAFSREYDFGYYNAVKYGYTMPVVKLDIDYKQQVRYDDTITIETEYIPTDAAKAIFDYRIYRNSDNKLAIKARTIQVYTDLNGELSLVNPEFVTEWKKKYNLL